MIMFDFKIFYIRFSPVDFEGFDLAYSFSLYVQLKKRNESGVIITVHSIFVVVIILGNTVYTGSACRGYSFVAGR